MTNLFLDSEFTGLTADASLISLALVASDGRYFYAEFKDYDHSQLSEWHQQHVMPHLLLPHRAMQLPPGGT